MVGRARQAAKDTAAKLPRPVEQKVSLRAADFNGVRSTGLLLDGDEARLARKAARRLGLARTLDDTSAWAAFGALAALLRVVDDGRRHSVIVDTAGARSVFSRWATKIGFAPLAVDVMRPDVVGTDIDAGSVDRDIQIQAVNEVIAEIGAADIEQILVFNKIDQTGTGPGVRHDAYGRINSLSLSARTGEGVDLLRELLRARALQNASLSPDDGSCASGPEGRRRSDRRCRRISRSGFGSRLTLPFLFNRFLHADVFQ